MFIETLLLKDTWFKPVLDERSVLDLLHKHTWAFGGGSSHPGGKIFDPPRRPKISDLTRFCLKYVLLTGTSLYIYIYISGWSGTRLPDYPPEILIPEATRCPKFCLFLMPEATRCPKSLPEGTRNFQKSLTLFEISYKFPWKMPIMHTKFC